MYLPFIITSGLLAIVLLFFVIEHSKFIRRFYGLLEENKRLNRNTNHEVEKIMENAVASSEALIDQARIKAQEIIAETKIFSEQIQNRFLEMSEEAVKSQIAEYNSKFEDSQKQLTQMFQNISNSVAAKSDEEVRKFTEKLGADLADQALARKSQTEEYQKTLYSKVDDSIFAILDDVAQQVVGKSIDYKEHEKLVTKALVEAKHDHFIE